MASWGDIQTYNDMIDDLYSFATTVREACDTLVVAAKTCADAMENDKASLQASKNVIMSAEKYEEAITLAGNLAKALAEERDELIEYLKALEELEGE